MSSSRLIRGSAWAGVVMIAAALAAISGAAQTSGTPERFTAFAVNMGTPGPGGAGAIDITVNRWSTDAERDRLMNVLLENGPEKLLDALRKLPRVGNIRTPNSLGYDLRFARRTPLAEGGERVVIATDRPIGFWEAVNRPRSIDYPFTLIELHINPDGEGEGKLSLATKVIPDKESNQIVLENYASQPVMLNHVKRQKAK